jgi:hypothetical protein
MAKFFLALIGISVATLVGTFVFAAFALRAGSQKNKLESGKSKAA